MTIQIKKPTLPKKAVKLSLLTSAAALLALSVGYIVWGVIFSYNYSPERIFFSNLTDRSVTISWVTENQEEGVVLVKERKPLIPVQLSFNQGNFYYDDRDYVVAELTASQKITEAAQINSDYVLEDIVVEEVGKYLTHHVTVTDLKPETEYYFLVGDGRQFIYVSETSSGNRSVQTLTEIEELSVPHPAYGKVTMPKGSLSNQQPVTDGIVYLQIAEVSDLSPMTSLISAPLNSAGSWYFDLNSLLDQNSTQYLKSRNANDFATKDIIIAKVEYGDLTVEPFRDLIETTQYAPADNIRIVPNFILPTDGSTGDGNASSVLGGLVSPVYADWCITCEGKEICAGEEAGGFEAVWGGNAEQQWKKEAQAACAAKKVPELHQDPGFVPTACGPVSYTEVGAYGSNDGCTYNCQSYGETDQWGGCHPNWGPNSVCRKADPSCGTPCSGTQCVEGQYCPTGEHQCCPVGCETAGQEGNSGGGGGGGGTGGDSGGGGGSSTACPNKKDPEIQGNPEYFCNLDGIDNNCAVGDVCGDLNTDTCTCGKSTIQCAKPCTQELFDGNATTDLVCCIQSPKSTSTVFTCGWIFRKNCTTDIGFVLDTATSLSSCQGTYDAGTRTCPGASSTPAGACTGCKWVTDSNGNSYAENRGDTGCDYSCDNLGNINDACCKYDESASGGKQCTAMNGACASGYSSCVVDGASIACAQDSDCCSYNCVAGSCKPKETPFTSNITYYGDLCNSASGECICYKDGWSPKGYFIKSGQLCTVEECNPRVVGEYCGQTNSKTCRHNQELGGYFCEDINTSIPSNEKQNNVISLASSAYASSSIDVLLLNDDNSVQVLEEGLYCTYYDGTRYCAELEQIASNNLFVDLNGNGVLDEGEPKVGGEIAVQEVSLESSKFTYTLREGLNIVAFPFVFDGSMASELLSYLNQSYDNSFYSIAKFNSKWAIVGENIEQYSSTDFPIVPGQGYLIKSKRDITIELEGKKVLSPFPVGLQQGWNLIGVHGSSSNYTAETLIDSLNANNYTANNVSRWPAEKGRFEGYQKEEIDGVNQVYGFDFPLVQNSGYFLRIVEGSGHWTP